MTGGLFRALLREADVAPDRVVYTFLRSDADLTLTLRETVDRSLSRRNRLSGVLGPGDVVVLAFAPSASLTITFWAVLAAGATAIVYAHPRPGQSQDDYVAGVLRFASDEHVDAVITDVPVAVDDPPVPLVVIDGLDDDAPADGDVPFVGDDAVAYVQYSSGTTGRPRGALIGHGAVVRHIEHVLDRYRWTHEDRVVGWLPLSHDMGLTTQILLPALSGASGVSMAPWDWLRRPATLFRAVSDHGGSLSWMPNFAFKLCLSRVSDDELDGVDLATWRIVGNGSELVEPDVLHSFQERFQRWGLPPNALIVGYGMAENVVAVSTTMPGQPVRVEKVDMEAVLRDGCVKRTDDESTSSRVVTSCGRPIDGTEIGILRADGTFGADLDTGEVVIRGDSLFGGYRGRPDATAAAHHGGWYRTGDLGYLSGGELFVLERLDDLIIVDGRNVRPHDIEVVVREVLGQRGNVAAALGVREPRRGTQVAVAVCELRDPESVDQAGLTSEIRAEVHRRLGISLHDVRCLPRNSIPRTTSGKVARRAAAAQYLQGA